MTTRIAMWSGPRNISTAMMRAFENRPDAVVVDEPFYAAYLAATGKAHPMRDDVLASQRRDWRVVAEDLLAPRERPIFYQKQMTHHMLPGVDLGWMDACRNVFLIRAPEAVLASYAARHDEVALEDIGFVRQAELFDREAARLGHAPPVIDAADVLGDPRATLCALCGALAIPFREEMLAWPAGARATDGAWAPAWYAAVQRSTGFGPPAGTVTIQDLDPALKPIAEAARPYYERLAKFRLRN
jgi:hypothetical protein